jgi:hypothetical protein
VLHEKSSGREHMRSLTNKPKGDFRAQALVGDCGAAPAGPPLKVGRAAGVKKSHFTRKPRTRATGEQ